MDTVQEIELPTGRMIARIEGAIGWMIFNNPERRNAVSLDMWQAMPAILDRFEQDPAVRVIVLTGMGERAFVAGADISQFEQQRASADQVAHYDGISGEANRRLAVCPKPTIAMIRGYCIGGGVGIAVACDLRIAAEGAKFGVPATRLGLGYGADGVKKLMDLVGPSHTKEIFFTARHFSAAEALGMGLANRVLPEADLEAYVRAYCATIAENAPLTIKAVKITVGELAKESPRVDHDLCAKVVQACFDSEDYVEGRRAFMEKRKPVFRGA
ncbi:MAG: enoyl-CoA hydratase [Rhodospirillales bacterium 70-18]|nr:enoyl-CoA hydratase/isomerase family protein [Rhodospirillales bacterium]OJY64028.1 MAG: enoyl-CoA hydratase [Rhodospirillales bacterium 70-18]